jgi:hypothetical protein
MIEFVCPGCTKSYEANRAFAGFETRCLRCGTVVRIPAKSGASAPVLANAGLPKPKRVAAPPRPAPPPVEVPTKLELDFDPEPQSTSTATMDLPPPPAPKRRSLKAESVPETSTDAPAEAAPVATPADAKRKKKRIIIGSAAGAVLLIAVLIAAFSGGKKPEKPVVKNDPPPAVKAPDPPPKKVEPPPPPKVVALEPAPVPRPSRPAVEYELTAAALQVEYAEGPPACDQKYSGRDLLVHGVFHSYTLGKVTIVASDEKSPPLNFTLLLPSELKPGELLPNPGLVPGQPVVVRGTYQVGCRFVNATVEGGETAVDRTFINKSVVLENAIVRSLAAPTGSVPYFTLTLEPPATDSRLAVMCYFKPSDVDEAMRLKPGQKLDIRGRCSGRNFGTVRLDNCAILPPQTETSEVLRLPAEEFFTLYEADLLPFPRVNPRGPMTELLPVTAEGLGHAYQIDPRSANLVYRNKAVQLSGYVQERHAMTRMVVFQCGTDCPFLVAAIFSPAAFDLLPEDRNLVIRGVCAGVNGGYIRIESADSTETGKGAIALRTDVDFLPYRLGKEYIVDQLTPPAANSSKKESQVNRLAVRFGGDDLIQVVLQKQGTINSTTLFKEPLPERKWANYTPRVHAQMRRYRVRDGVVEIGQPFVAGEKKEVQEFWEPVLKSGLKRGQSWSIRHPDNRMATYTVSNFTQMEGKPDQLEIKVVLRNPMDPTHWEERAVTYARGIGEIRRVVSFVSDRGEVVVASEMRLISDGTPPAPPMLPELKSEPKK